MVVDLENDTYDFMGTLSSHELNASVCAAHLTSTPSILTDLSLPLLICPAGDSGVL